MVGSKGPVRSQLSDRAGLEHKGILIRLHVDDLPNMMRPRPAGKRVDKERLTDSLSGLSNTAGRLLWGSVRQIVDDLPRTRMGRSGCVWWNHDLERMRKDVTRSRRKVKKDPGATEDYNLVKKVYRAMLIRSRYDYIEKAFQTMKDPEFFKMVRNLQSKRTLPSMVRPNGEVVSQHACISDMIAEQVDPGDAVEWTSNEIDMSAAVELGAVLKQSPTNTGPGIDDIGYPMLRAWWSMADGNMERMVNYGLRHDVPDWHIGEVVLIPKADKPLYDVVQSWRMIHLLPTVAKVVQRIVLLGIASKIDLGDMQFGSRKKRGVHDAMAVIYEFLEHNKFMKCALMSIDIEGGFDKIGLDNLCDFLIARECDAVLVLWVRRWAMRRRVRFRFNGRVSKVYHQNKRIPQGSPLSPFLFEVYIADMFSPRIRVGPSLRRMVISYVDDGTILVVAESMDMAKHGLVEAYEDCNRVAVGRGMRFSAIKTKWIGFGDRGWDGLEMSGLVKEQERCLRVLGFFFNMYNNFSAHVQYWLKSGLDVRRRILVMGRRFGEKGLGAHGTYRLFQTVYLPTVYYGLEFMAGHRRFVQEIQRHVNDCLRSVFRTPLLMANNILLAEYRTVPVGTQGRYLRKKAVSRMVNYRYCENLPWFACIRKDWCPNLKPSIMNSDVVFPRIPTVVQDADKDAAMARWVRYH